MAVSKFRTYPGNTAIALILAATVGCAAQTGSALTAAPTPSNLTDLLHTDLDAGQKQLEARGYEIVRSNTLAKEQYWWNEGSKACVSLKFDDSQIAALNSINTEACTKRVGAARKARENYVYADGKANVHSPSLEIERKQFIFQGYKATYWVKEALSGRGVEYWLSADGTKCVALVFETKDGTYVMTGSGEPRQCVNPAPRRAK